MLSPFRSSRLNISPAATLHRGFSGACVRGRVSAIGRVCIWVRVLAFHRVDNENMRKGAGKTFRELETEAGTALLAVTLSQANTTLLNQKAGLLVKGAALGVQPGQRRQSSYQGIAFWSYGGNNQVAWHVFMRHPTPIKPCADFRKAFTLSKCRRVL